MNRLLGWLIVFVVMVFGLQWLVPGWIGGASADWLGKAMKGPRPTIEVSAIPFWELASGKFQWVVIRGHDASFSGVVVKSFGLDWQDGQIGLGNHGQPIRVIRVGHLKGHVNISAEEIARLVDERAILQHSTVSLASGAMTIAGVLALDGRRVHLAVRGPLVIADGGESVTFRPQELNQAKWPLTTTITVLKVSQLKLPVRLALTRLQISHEGLSLSFQNR